MIEKREFGITERKRKRSLANVTHQAQAKPLVRMVIPVRMARRRTAPQTSRASTVVRFHLGNGMLGVKSRIDEIIQFENALTCNHSVIQRQN